MPTRSARLGEDGVRERYGNLFDIYHEITNENAYQVPMRIFPAVHYTMGGLWVDYNLMSNVPGLFVLGEANFSDHGANRLGASALMQGLADGYFVIPYTIGDYLATQKPGSRPAADGPEFLAGRGQRQGDHRAAARRPRASSPVSHFHKRLGHILWQHCGMARNRAGLEQALREIPALREEFWATSACPARPRRSTSRSSRRARVADFLELGELLCRDALAREESCGVPLPRGAPVSGRRVQARRRELRARRRLGVPGRGQGAAAQRRAAQLRVREDERQELQVRIRTWSPRIPTSTISVTAARLAPGRARASPGRFVEYAARGPESRTCRSSRCSTS